MDLVQMSRSLRVYLSILTARILWGRTIARRVSWLDFFI